MNTFCYRCPHLVGLWALILCAVMQTAVYAQEDEKMPFIEPAETHAHGQTKLRFVEARPAQNGRWDTLPVTMPINPVHVALMQTGKVLIIAGSGNDPDNKNFQAAVWDPRTTTSRTFNISWDMFCNGMVILPDGRPFVLGGTLKYDNFLGEPRTAAFDPLSEKFSDMPNMSGGGRWYPTGTVLGNGSVLVYSGLNDTDGGVNRAVEIWTGTAWSAAGASFAGVPLYPREHLLPSGRVFESGANRDSQMYDPVARTFASVATTNFDRDRDYGTSVLLPLTVDNGFKPGVMILGGSSPIATDTTELIDLSVPSPKWVLGPRMAKARIQLNATILPNGRVLVSGGSEKDEDNATAVKEAQLYDPASNTFSSGSTMEFPRLYHSNTLLLPDATVVAFGGNPQRKVYQHEIEIYSPPYLFNADGSPAQRPTITSVTPARYGKPFNVHTPDAKDIKSVVLVRNGSVTHAFNMEQRLVGMSFTVGSGALSVTAPPNGNIAPPGYYMLFILNSSGVPSVASMLSLGQGGGAPPTAATNVTAAAGNARVTLGWSASSGATSYNVKRSTTSGGPYTTIASPTTTGYTNTGLTNGTTYYYVVTAVNTAGESGNSSQVSATPTAGTTSINYGSGFTASGMQLNGKASLNGTRLRMTDTATNEGGSAFFTTAVNVQNFITDFSFQLTNANADGIAFVIQNSEVTALGTVGGNLGYTGIANSVAVKLDLYDNSGEGTNSTGLYTGGAAPWTPALDLTSSGVNLHSGHVFDVHMSYDGTTLTMSITDATTLQSFSTSWTVNIPTAVGGNTALAGFTGGTGGLTALQEILTWTY